MSASLCSVSLPPPCFLGLQQHAHPPYFIFSPPLPSLTCFLVLHQLSLPWVSLPLCLHSLLSGLD